MMKSARLKAAKESGKTVNQLAIASTRLNHNEASHCCGNLNRGNGGMVNLADGGGFKFTCVIGLVLLIIG